MRHVANVQVELAGTCSAACEFCDIWGREESQLTFMDAEIAHSVIRQAKELRCGSISLQVTGESTMRRDFMEFVPRDYPCLLSTNALHLDRGDLLELAQLPNLLIILAVLWSEPEKKREISRRNALDYVARSAGRHAAGLPTNRGIYLQQIMSEHAIPYARQQFDDFAPYLKALPQLNLHWKMPYTQQPDQPTLGYLPTSIPEGPRVQVDRMPTPQSCGNDCLAFSPNPDTDIIVQVDGEIKPCFKRTTAAERAAGKAWGLGNARDTRLADAVVSPRFEEIRSIWSRGDPDAQLACHDCIRLAVPYAHPGGPKTGAPESFWWSPTGSGVPPSAFTSDQAARSNDPNPYPKIDLPIEEAGVTAG